MRSVVLAATARNAGLPTIFCLSEFNQTVSDFAARYDLPLSILSKDQWCPALAQDAAVILDFQPTTIIMDSPNIEQSWSEVIADRGTPLIYIGGTGANLIEADGCLWPDIAPEIRPPVREFAAGIEYLPLAPEYRETNGDRSNVEISKVLITTGGVDHYDVSSKAIAALDKSAPTTLSVRVAVGAHFDNVDSIQFHADHSRHSVELMPSPSGLWDLISWCDFAITGGGGTLGELACSQTPAIGIAIWPIQAPMVDLFASKGAIIGLHYSDETTFAADLILELTRIFNTPGRLRQMSDIGPTLVDGLGAARAIEWIASVSNMKDQ